MTFSQRVGNFIIYCVCNIIYDWITIEYQVPFYKAHGGNAASINDIARESLLLMQGFFGIDVPRDFPPNVSSIIKSLTIRDI